MIWRHCGHSSAFSLISWIFINQFEDNIYYLKAEYLGYRMISLISLVMKNENMREIVYNSINIQYKLFRFCLVITDIVMHGSMSQILYSGPGFYFM